MERSKDEELKLSYEGFLPGHISKDQINQKLEKNSKGRIMTGVKVVDDVFGGILPSDIVILGSKTGAGKTALASQIALYNTMIGKNVYMYALEAEENEIQMRILYERVVAMAKTHNPNKKYNYKYWIQGRYKDLNFYYEKALEEVNHFKNFNVFYRKNEFNVDDFVKITMSVKDKADLFIIDHIHYFDFDGKNENKELGDAIKKIRDIALLTEVPVLLVAHLRKSANVQFKLLPDIDDFHGSSDLAKIATKAIIMATKQAYGDNVETLFYFPKFRGFSAPSKFLFKTMYDIYANQYQSGYEVYNFKFNNTQFKFPENLVDPEELSWLG